MCGIAAAFNLRGQETVLADTLLLMAKQMKHRGPDDEGYVFYSKNQDIVCCVGDDSSPDLCEFPEYLPINDISEKKFVAGLAHRRLSILDLSSSGHQPMGYLERRYWISYNGEIYNYIELREELSLLAYKFRTGTDTEVILAAYAEWGPDCLKKFNGDWSFVIYDVLKREFFVARDRFAVKPLYYYVCDDEVFFFSDIKAILSSNLIQVKPNVDSFFDYLNNGASEWNHQTVFDGVFRFPAAHYLKFTMGEEVNPLVFKCFWKLEPDLSTCHFDQNQANKYAREYYDLLKDAVRIRLRSDVNLGVALSGGLDSSSIVYLVSEIYSERNEELRPKTFSIVHSNLCSSNCDETSYIDLVSKAIGCDSYKIDSDIGNARDILEKMCAVAKYWESPSDDLGVGGMLTYKLANDMGFKVTLDGQGADEQQAGYEFYAGSFLLSLPSGSIPKQIKCLFKNFGFRKMIVISILAALIKKIFGSRFYYRLFSHTKLKSITKLNKHLSYDLAHGLVNLLHYSDARSMYYSIESRMPFMDHRLVEYTANIPAIYKIHDGYTKYFARLAFDGKLPREIVWRKDKMGWPMPESLWFSKEVKGWCYDQIRASTVLSSLYREKKSKLAWRESRLIHVAIWENIFLDREEL